ncbi:Zinc finger protein [Plasmodium coatneyi]|uniref:RING-type E3 ubiquitin transferase n=1 Tax=Plasmodium coatneyi TaxID=208452 RepID=A0A1B1DXX3_9APIC|nr:Zinc finger protein [Plasmodium coatneyi]ANQ07608.1 Zinc finger protein [Plasmodium coatneyi]
MINDLEEDKNYNVEVSIDSKSGTQEENSEEKIRNVCVVNRENAFYDISQETEHSSEQRNHEKNELNNFYDLTEVNGKKEEVICISSNSTNVVKSGSSGSSLANGNEEKGNLEVRDDQIVPIEVEPKHDCNIGNCGDVCDTTGRNRNENNTPSGSHNEDNNDRNYNKEEKTRYVLCNICADIMEKSIFQDHLYAHTLESPEKNEQNEQNCAYGKQNNLNNGLFDTRNKSFYTNFNSDRSKQNRCALKRSFNNTTYAFNNSEIILTDNNEHHAEDDRIFDMIYNYNSNLDRFRNNPAVINKRNNNSVISISEKKSNMVDSRNNFCNKGVSAQNIIEMVNSGENKVEDTLSASRNVTRNDAGERSVPNKLEANRTAVDNYLSAMRESLYAIFPDPNASSFENSTTSNNTDDYKNEEHLSSIINDIHSMISAIQANVKRAAEKSNNRVNINSASADIDSFVNKSMNSILTDINDIKGTNRNGKNDHSVENVLSKKLKKIYQSLDNVNKKINAAIENNNTDGRNSIANSISGGILNRISITIVNSTDGGNGSEVPSASVTHSSNGNVNISRSNSYRDSNSSGEPTNRGRQNNFYSTSGPGTQEFSGTNGSTFFHNQNVFSHESFFTGIPADSAHTYFNQSCASPYSQIVRTESGSINDINYLYSNLVDRYPCICENSGFSHFDNNSNNIWPLRRVTNSNTYRTSNDSPNSRSIKEANNVSMNSNMFNYRNEGSNNGRNNISPINNGRNTSNPVNETMGYNLINNGVGVYPADPPSNNPFLFMVNRQNRNIRSDVRTNQVVNTIRNNYSFISTSRNSMSNRNANQGRERIHNGNSNIGTTSIININNFNCVTTNNNYNNNNNRTAAMAGAVGAPIGPAVPVGSPVGTPVGFPAVGATVNAAVMVARELAGPPGPRTGGRAGTIAGGPCGQGVAPAVLGPPTSTCSSRVSTTTVRANTEGNLDPLFSYHVFPPRGASRTNRTNGASSNGSRANNNGNMNNNNIPTNRIRNVNSGSEMPSSLSASSAEDVTISSNTQRAADNLFGANLRREQTLTRSHERTNRIVSRTTRGVANVSSSAREQPASGNKKIGTRAKLKENNDYLIVHFDIKKNENNNLKICSICYENYQHNESLIFLPCTHNFHKACIIEWINKKSTCPICKINIKNF